MGEHKSSSHGSKKKSKEKQKGKEDKKEDDTEPKKGPLTRAFGAVTAGSRRNVLMGLLVLVLFGGGAYWFWRKRKARGKSSRRGAKGEASVARGFAAPERAHEERHEVTYDDSEVGGRGTAAHEYGRMDLGTEIEQANARARRIAESLRALEARNEQQAKEYRESFAGDAAAAEEQQSLDSAFLLKEDRDKRREAAAAARQETQRLLVQARREAAAEQERLSGLHERYIAENGVPYMTS